MEERKKDSLKKVAHWDKIESQRSLFIREMEDKVEALEDFKRWALLEEIYGNKNLGRFGSKKGTKTQGFST